MTDTADTPNSPRTPRTVPIVTKRFVPCQVCGEGEFQIEHVLGQRFSVGPWYCDNCAAGHWIDLSRYESGEVTVTRINTKPEHVWLICELVPQSEPVRIVYEVIDHHDDPDRESQFRSWQYLVEEHQCPTNITGSIEAVLVGSDDDAHGLFTFVGVVPRMRRGPVSRTGDVARHVLEHL